MERITQDERKQRAQIGQALAGFAIDLQVNDHLVKSGCASYNIAYNRAEDKIVNIFYESTDSWKEGEIRKDVHEQRIQARHDRLWSRRLGKKVLKI